MYVLSDEIAWHMFNVNYSLWAATVHFVLCTVYTQLFVNKNTIGWCKQDTVDIKKLGHSKLALYLLFQSFGHQKYTIF